MSRIHLSMAYRSKVRCLLPVVVAGSLLSGCATTTQPPVAPDSVAAAERAQRQKLEEELARLRLVLLEREAQIRGLSQKLDAAILEVVRAMAKVQGRESKAEAATSLAEAEIALKLLERDAAGREKDSDFSEARQLLKTAAQEFQKENYGGAMYLTSQAKSAIKGEQARRTSRAEMPKIEGEVLFSLPLSLRALGKSNIREGPGLNFKVLFVLEEGAPLTGQSYKGLWVRVRSEDGRSGWVFYNLIGQR